LCFPLWALIGLIAFCRLHEAYLIRLLEQWLYRISWKLLISCSKDISFNKAYRLVHRSPTLLPHLKTNSCWLYTQMVKETPIFLSHWCWIKCRWFMWYNGWRMDFVESLAVSPLCYWELGHSRERNFGYIHLQVTGYWKSSFPLKFLSFYSGVTLLYIADLFCTSAGIFH
jgi:hypothetical protein